MPTALKIAPDANESELVDYFEHALLGRRSRDLQSLFVRRGDGHELSTPTAAQTIAAGVAASAVGLLAVVVAAPKSAVIAAVGIDKATLRRREAGRKMLDPHQAEGLLRTMELAAMATETFGTLDKASEWLGRAHPMLDGRSPLEHATNGYAQAQVKAMLAALRYGGVV